MPNPFVTRTVNTLSDVADMVPWFLERGQNGDRVAVALKTRAKKIAFATDAEALVVDLKAVPVASTLIARQLLSGSDLRLDFRKTSEDFPELVRWVADNSAVSVTNVLRELEPKVAGDLHMAAYCIDQVVTPHSKFVRPEHDAYEIALLLPQYEYGAIPYYSKVGLPLALSLAETALFKPAEANWWITYPELWTRVLAYETHDPTLTWAFAQGRDVHETVGAMFDAGREYGHLVLCWVACGMDLHSFKQRFKTDDLPDDLDAWNLDIKRHLPNLVLGISDMKDYYVSNKGIKTLYGRNMRAGQRPSEAVAHVVYGTAEDIAAVATVACWTNREGRGTLIKEITGGPGSESVRVSGTSERRTQGTWIQILRAVSELGDPLNPVSLAPIVTIP